MVAMGPVGGAHRSHSHSMCPSFARPRVDACGRICTRVCATLGGVLFGGHGSSWWCTLLTLTPRVPHLCTAEWRCVWQDLHARVSPWGGAVLWLWVRVAVHTVVSLHTHSGARDGDTAHTCAAPCPPVRSPRVSHTHGAARRPRSVARWPAWLRSATAESSCHGAYLCNCTPPCPPTPM